MQILVTSSILWLLSGLRIVVLIGLFMFSPEKTLPLRGLVSSQICLFRFSFLAIWVLIPH